MDGVTMEDRDRKIREALLEITGIELPDQENRLNDHLYPPYTPSIRNILLMCDNYDYFLLEEEGRLSDLFSEWYEQQYSAPAPSMTRIDHDEKQIINILEAQSSDLLIVFNHPDLKEASSLAKMVKDLRKDLPVILVANNTPELQYISENISNNSIDWVFTWTGDGNIFLAIIQYLEDSISLQTQKSQILNNEVARSGNKWILLVEGSVQHYSNYLSIIYEEIGNQMRVILKEDLTKGSRERRITRRTKLIIARTIKEAGEYYNYFQDQLLCVITDIREDPNGSVDTIAGLEFIRILNGDFPDLPVLILSSYPDNIHLDKKSTIRTIMKHSPMPLMRFRNFVVDSIGPIELRLPTENEKTTVHISNMQELEKALWEIPENKLIEHIQKDTLPQWLFTRMEFELAEKFRSIIQEQENDDDIRKFMLKAIEEYKSGSHLGSVTRYSRNTYGPHVRFSRIGRGAMGGKARGVAFMDKILTKHHVTDHFPDMEIYIPRTIVVCTDIFDSFMEHNGLLKESLLDLPDDRIAVRFMEADFPATVIGDIYSIVREIQTPMVIRSSSLLEDALFQPFAGVYSSVFLPNDSWETDVRFQEVCGAIKFIYASTFFEKARNYMKSTPNSQEDEKMAVIVQEVVGTKHGKYFYPTISGVGKSFDYYPSGSCIPDDGVVNIALGLGKTAVDGGTSYSFCPLHPRSGGYGTIEDALEQSQKKFFAIDLSSYVSVNHRSEGSRLKELNLADAEKHGSLNLICSTYSANDNRLYPGISRDGARILDFSPILEMDALPLVKAIRSLLRICEISVGGPVEIEFAVNIAKLNSDPAEVALLQVRSMVFRGSDTDVEIGDHEKEQVLCQSNKILGNGIIDTINDIVYVKNRDFSMSRSQDVVQQIDEINSTLIKEGKPYLLIGPGRWGSSDPWLGIPVCWSDVAGARIIVETKASERMIDPSQGSHFFHNMVSAEIGYFNLTTGKEGFLDRDWLDSLSPHSELKDVRHIKLKEPLQVRMNGKTGEGIILKHSIGGRKHE